MTPRLLARVAVALAATALLAPALAGCASDPVAPSAGPDDSASSDSATPADPTPDADADADAEADGSGSSASFDDPCSIMSLEQANGVSGPEEPFTSTSDGVYPGVGDHYCKYSSDGLASVAIVSYAATQSYDDLLALEPDGGAVDQVGDRASYSDSLGELIVEVDGQAFSVLTTGTTPLGLGNMVALGSAVAGHL